MWFRKLKNTTKFRPRKQLSTQEGKEDEIFGKPTYKSFLYVPMIEMVLKLLSLVG